MDGGGRNENRDSKRNKNNENRVGLSPSGVHALVEQGHEETKWAHF